MLEYPKQQDITLEFKDLHETSINNLATDNFSDKRTPTDAFQAAQDEWDVVQCIEPTYNYNYEDTNSPQHYADVYGQLSPTGAYHASLLAHVHMTPHTDFDEVWEFFERQDMHRAMSLIKPTLERRGLNGLVRSIFGPRKMKSDLIPERNLLFAVAQCQLDNNEPIHFQILQTIYKVLTGTKVDCPRYGNHWDEIGFQGLDPATDLRGVGLLGLVHALHLVTHEGTLPLARDIYRLSHDIYSQFPFMVLSINVTRISLQALREGCLNRECNSRGNVRHVLNEFYAAVLFHIYWVWKSENKTIKDSGFLIKDAESHCKRNVKLVLQQLQLHLRRYAREGL